MARPWHTHITPTAPPSQSQTRGGSAYTHRHELGFTVVQRRKVKTPRQGHGQNGALRVAYEDIWIMEKAA